MKIENKQGPDRAPVLHILGPCGRGLVGGWCLISLSLLVFSLFSFSSQHTLKTNRRLVKTHSRYSLFFSTVWLYHAAAHRRSMEQISTPAGFEKERELCTSGEASP